MKQPKLAPIFQEPEQEQIPFFIAGAVPILVRARAKTSCSYFVTIFTFFLVFFFFNFAHG